MKKERVQKILNDLTSTGADFAEVFLEERENKEFHYIDNRLDELSIRNKKGIGLRISKENRTYYASTNDLSDSEIEKITNSLKKNIHDNIVYENIQLGELKKYTHKGIEKYSDVEIKRKLKDINDLIRKQDQRINQVYIKFKTDLQNVTIANHSGKYVSEKRIYTRFFLRIYFQEKEQLANVFYSKGMCIGNELLDQIDFNSVINDLIKTGIDKLYAKPCIGQVMPVVIAAGDGGVIFHEACGHALEATSVSDRISILSDDLGKQIASSKVTIIDDGTLDLEWGSTQIDDEGNKTQKNILIQEGKLVNFLVDELNERKMCREKTGSGRREDYSFAPTSRMNNTYLAPGTDSVEEMIKSIDLGLYAKSFRGGQVSTETGDFNFGCDTAYMIRNGKIAECVKGASLIGNTKEILKEIEMVGNDLQLGQGLCGSISGLVPVNNGTPTIKVGHILVGGDTNE